MYDTVIFDLDGTLLYTLEDLQKSVNFALTNHGFPTRTIEEIRVFVGNGVKKLMERSIPDGENNPVFEQCLAEFKDYYGKTMADNVKPYDGILELLNKLNSQGIKCAVVSNKYDVAVKQLCAKYFGSNILIAIGESENIRKKPAPDSVLKVIKELHAKNPVYVGDSEVDIQTAQNANIPCISVAWGYKDTEFLVQNGAKIVVNSADELCKAINLQVLGTTEIHQE